MSSNLRYAPLVAADRRQPHRDVVVRDDGRRVRAGVDAEAIVLAQTIREAMMPEPVVLPREIDDLGNERVEDSAVADVSAAPGNQ